MRRFMIVMGFAGLLGLASAAMADDKCTCESIKKAGIGWCSHCSEGLAYGQEIKSEKVYKELAGEKAPKDMKGKGCAAAAAKNGTCEHCHVSFANGMMYHSAAAHDLATGKKVDVKEVKCADCKKLVTTGK